MSALTPTPMVAKAVFQAMLPPIVVHMCESDHTKDTPLSDHQAAATPGPTRLLAAPASAPKTA